MLHSIVEAVALPFWPWWALCIIVLLVGTSPMVVKRWRQGSSWHKSHE